jgi:hypothetical protein
MAAKTSWVLKTSGARRLVSDDESDANDLTELLSVVEDNEGSRRIGLEFIGDEITRVGLKLELGCFFGGSGVNKQPHEEA